MSRGAERARPVEAVLAVAKSNSTTRKGQADKSGERIFFCRGTNQLPKTGTRSFLGINGPSHGNLALGWSRQTQKEKWIALEEGDSHRLDPIARLRSKGLRRREHDKFGNVVSCAVKSEGTGCERLHDSYDSWGVQLDGGLLLAEN